MTRSGNISGMPGSGSVDDSRHRRVVVLAVVALVLVAALVTAVTASLGSNSRRRVGRAQVQGKRSSGTPSTRASVDLGAGWPGASDTGADPSTITQSLPVSSGFYSSTSANLTIANAEIGGGIYWTGRGTLTLRNDIIKTDWTQSWAAVAAIGGGSVTIDHVTILGVNVGAPGRYTKGITMQSGGRLSVSALNESGICQNTIGSGPTVIRDSYIHDIGSGNGATCHATAVEIEGPAHGPILITHNTIDEFPGRQFQAGSDGAIFVKGLYGPISGLVIDDNFLHSAYSDIEIAPDGTFGIAGPVVTDNCLAWPRGGEALSAPRGAVAQWSGNQICNLAGKRIRRLVAYR